ncbi:uncharacterized protein LOC111290170 [Durio zibethinus]|uniref:Uncharacterized protein LOC111290170 n=1 Tax=Durio zibethinus TaxID=66656 RepID=A0A6P5YA31_DURZI|nr:uncharacterized protein LOC111290170 [Durio zibethinus]
MGNAASCAPSIILIISSGVVKVLFPNGNMQIYTKPVKAADLMLKNPEQFVCDSSSLEVDYRIHGLTADEVLERCQLYFLLPMELLYSVLTHEEMSSKTPENQVSKTSYSVERYSKQRSWKPALETILEAPCRQ